MRSYYPEWRHKQIIAAIVAAGFAVDFALRRYFIDAFGMTPVEFVGGLVAGKYAANAAVLPFLDKEQREDWYYAESEMYSWGGLENIGYLQFLNVIPNYFYGVPKVLFESGMLIGDAMMGPIDTTPKHGKYERWHAAYIAGELHRHSR